MEKQKVYKWQETNLALFGSDLEKKIKAASADGEKAWDDVGQKPELKVWRIEKFQVKPWPKRKYGQFHKGDSYIVLHTYKKSPNTDALAFDIHFWIGEESTQDEYGTAAYKTVELDHKLKDMAIQHREVMGHESREFLKLFDGKEIRYLEGGIESGFRHVEDEIVEPILYQVKGRRGAIVLTQIKRRKDKMNSGDVFILDTGDKIYQWNGKASNSHEKLKAKSIVDSVCSDRGGKTKAITLDEDQGDEVESEFWESIPGERKFLGFTVQEFDVKDEEKGGNDESIKQFRKVLYKLSDNSGEIAFSRRSKAKRSSNQVNRRYLDTDDVFVLDDGFTVWVWVGKGASSSERGLSMMYAMRYLEDKKRPAFLPITRITEGNEPPKFTEHFVQDDSCMARCPIM